ncbi:Crp/Fnr family transcriptional regulator [Lutimaribacter marinistellae]|uniref:Crp/Fnr family transcriptional regulator n=1 Tax=Lutimaribacter marinistellae TaxID=1820329 RepID=A0ABV7TCF0_9RHOB
MGEANLSEISARGWIAQLPEEDRERILGRFLHRSADRGIVLYRVGDEPDGLYYLASGCIRMDTVQSDHGPTMLSHFHAGAWLGEVELFSGMPRLTTLTVLRPSTYLFLPVPTLESLAKERPEIWRALGHLAAEHVALAVAGLDDLTIRASDARLAAILLRLCGARVPTDPAGEATELDVTQNELAQMTNLSRSMVGDLLTEFERKGILDRRYGKLVVRDLPAMQGMLTDGRTDTAT